MTTRRFLALLFVLVTAHGNTAAQTPMPYGANYYEFVSGNITWQNAMTAAAGRSFGGTPGHLATITSSGENAFLASLIVSPTFAGVWCAGQVDNAVVGRWMAGPEQGQVFSNRQSPAPGAYANWGGIEPNNAPSFLWMNVGPSFANIATGQWADDDDGVPSVADPVIGYFVEYETPRWRAFGAACVGPSGTPALAAVTLPDLGTNFQLAVTGMPPSGGLFAIALGFSDTVLPGFGALPFGLAMFGAPTCFAYCDLVSTSFATHTTGSGTYDLMLPAIPGLAGTVFFQQAYVFDSQANAAGALAANAGRALVL